MRTSTRIEQPRKPKGYLFGHDPDGAEIRISPAERRAHMHVIGASGKGKSKFLERLIRQDLKNRSVGALVLDPHGALVDDVMDYVSHRAPHLADRIVLFEPASQSESVIGFNPIPRSYDSLENAVQTLMDNILFAWGQGSRELPRVRTWLYNVLYPVVASKLTLVEALPMVLLPTKAERQALVSRINNAPVRASWDSYENTSNLQKMTLMEGVQNRVMRLLLNEQMRLVLSQQENALDLGQLMAEKKIVLISLRHHDRVHPEDLRMLGIMILADLFRAGMARNERLKNPPFHVYVDEFGQYVTPAVADALDQIRKKNVFFTVAHQHLAQLLREEVGRQILSSVMTNCRLKVAFGGLMPEDAEAMSKLMWTGRFDMKQIKHEHWGWQVKSRESTRTAYTEGESETDTVSASRSQTDSQTTGHATGVTETEGSSETKGRQDGWSRGQSQQSSEGKTEGTSHSDSATLSKGSSRGSNWNNSSSTTRGQATANMEGRSDTVGRGSSESVSANSYTSESRYSEGEGYTAGLGSSNATQSSSSESNSETLSSSRTTTDSKSDTTGSSRGGSDTKSLGHSTTAMDGRSQSVQTGRSIGTSAARTGGTSYAEARSRSRAESETESHSTGRTVGTSEGESHSKGRNRSKTTAVYDEKYEIPDLKSVTFWTLQELQAQQQGELMNLPTGLALMKNDIGEPTYVKVPKVKGIAWSKYTSENKLRATEERLRRANAKYYAPRAQVEAEAIERQTLIFSRPLQLNEIDLDDYQPIDPEDRRPEDDDGLEFVE